MEVWGAAEAARALGVSTPTVRRWAREDPGFPGPLAQLAQGRVWLAPEIRNWRRRLQRKRRKARAF